MVTIMKRDKVGAGLSTAAEIQASIQWRCMAIKSRNNSHEGAKHVLRFIEGTQRILLATVGQLVSQQFVRHRSSRSG
jgi:hypothetical protein